MSTTFYHAKIIHFTSPQHNWCFAIVYFDKKSKEKYNLVFWMIRMINLLDTCPACIYMSETDKDFSQEMLWINFRLAKWVLKN